MNTIAQSEVFFIISSVGFVLLWILLAICMIYVIRIMHLITRIMKKAEDGIIQMNDTANDMLEDIHDSAVFRFVFGKKHTHRKHTGH